eukprot:TRINITY_DN48692_c0_g1_i1.p1 TRINITY_DN48692_c0_g1~~TRINITY_DN48692_c0_g1_i1.p1  ORF type:complete len:121 (+),score=38.32 TRINITY_DN48692_c0_g1_i1:28-390(+)
MIRRPPRSTLSSSSAASDVYKRQSYDSATKTTTRTSGGGAENGGGKSSGGGGFLEALYAQNALEFKVIETIGTNNESIQARKMRIQLEDMKREIAVNDAAITKLTNNNCLLYTSPSPRDS